MAQDGARQKLKICPEPSGNKLSYVVCSPNSKGKRLSTQFVENDENLFHLAVMSQCEPGGDGHIFGNKLWHISWNLDLVRINVNM